MNIIKDISKSSESIKKCIFITTKNIDYIRNVQEINLLNSSYDDVEILGYGDKSYVLRLLKLWTKILFSKFDNSSDIFIGFAPQLIIPLFAWKFKKNVVAIDFFISCYDTLVDDRKKVKDNTVLSNIIKWIDKNTLNNADKIIVDTKAHGEYFCTILGANPSKVDVLYLEADTSIYREIKNPEKSDIYTVLYFGSILPLQGVDIILNSIMNIKDKNIKFQIIGPIKEEIKDKYKQDNLEYIPWLAQQDLATYIAKADLCLGGHFNKDINKARNTIAGKTYIYRAMNKAVILGDNSANRELFDEKQQGIYFVEMGNPKALADKILSIYEENE